jgi:DNA-binding transcriptional regulator YiaG
MPGVFLFASFLSRSSWRAATSGNQGCLSSKPLLWSSFNPQSIKRIGHLPNDCNIPIWNIRQAQVRLAHVKKSIYSPEQNELLKLLREKRKRAGMSQTDLAGRLGRSQSFVSKYESGELRLDLVQLSLICRALGTSLSSFVREFEKRTA